MPRFDLRFSLTALVVSSALVCAAGCQSTGGDSPSDADAAAAAKPTVSLASGIEGGTYHERYAVGIEKILVAWDVDARVTGGSSENLDLLAAGEVDFALAQADVLASRIEEEPDVFGVLEVVASFADECVFIARWVGGPVDSFDDLSRDVGERAAVINIGTPESGMAETWNYISSLVPEQANADVDQSDGEQALAKLREGVVDAVAWVTDPRNPDHVLLKNVRADEALGFMTVNDPRLEDVLTDGTEVYDLETIEVAGTDDVEIETLCTSALIVAGPQSSPDVMRELRAAAIGR